VGLAEWLVLALVPSLLIPMMSPAIGERYSLAATLAHGVCLFVAGAAFFSLAMFLSTLFDDLWRPLLIALAVAFFLAIVGEIAGSLGRNSIFGVMSGERYFRTGGLPWLGMLLSAAVSGALLYGAQVSIARRDF
jgi:ABC-type transport system involved in multi-copper enzyme maturation permease subunit